MKVFICCLTASVFYLALASGEKAKKSAALVTDKSSDSKPKRDASLLSSVYHGPSYKYLPPQSSSYGSYPGSLSGFSGGHVSGLPGGYRPLSSSHVYRHPSFSSSGTYHIPTPHGLGHHGGSASSYSGGHQGLGYPISNQYAGHGSTKYFGSGVSTFAGPHSSSTVGTGRPHTYVIGQGYGSSGLEHNLHSSVGKSAASGSGYHFSKGADGSVYSLGSSGLGSTQVLSNSVGSVLDEEHHTGHVHNGAGEHVYVIPNAHVANSGTHSSGNDQENDVVSTVAYLPPVKQHPLPSNSYGEPISSTGNSYNRKYHTPAGAERGPAYASGHKGLGYFGFAANKPNVLHTSISGLSFKQPSSYAKAPFTPSIFLGSKFEESALNSNSNNAATQYLPPSAGESDSSGYDYAIPTGPSINYQEPSYQQSVDIQSVAVHEPDSSYLPSKNNQDSLHEIPSAPSSSFLPPSNSYGTPYSN